MTSFYNVLTQLRNILHDHPDINVVTTGNMNEAALAKMTVFALAHINPVSATISGNSIQHSIQVTVMDRVDFNKRNVKDLEPNIYRGNDNLHDIWNTMLGVIAHTHAVLLRDTDYTMTVDEEVQCDPFDNRLEHDLAGITATFNITTENESAIC